MHTAANFTIRSRKTTTQKRNYRKDCLCLFYPDGDKVPCDIDKLLEIINKSSGYYISELEKLRKNNSITDHKMVDTCRTNAPVCWSGRPQPHLGPGSTADTCPRLRRRENPPRLPDCASAILSPDPFRRLPDPDWAGKPRSAPDRNRLPPVFWP